MKGFPTSLVIMMIIMLSFSLPVYAGAEEAVATIEGISGNLKIQRKGIGEWEAATLNAPLYPGDKLRTDIDSYAALIYADGSQLKLNSNTLLKFQQLEAEEKRSLQLLFGEIWVLVRPSGRSFEVETPAAIAQVRGTEFDIMVFPEGRSILTVLEGKISFSNEYGSVIVETLERTKADPGSLPPPLSRVEPISNG